MMSDAVEDKPVENKFSVLKRKFSDDPKARSFIIQMMEIAGKNIVCNIHRFLQILLIEVFFRAKFSFFQIRLIKPDLPQRGVSLAGGIKLDGIQQGQGI